MHFFCNLGVLSHFWEIDKVGQEKQHIKKKETALLQLKMYIKTKTFKLKSL